MKLLPILPSRRLILGGTLGVLLSFGAPSLVFSSPAATNAPAAKASAAKPTPTPAADVEKDKDTGKPIITTASGLKYVDLVVGKGGKPIHDLRLLL